MALCKNMFLLIFFMTYLSKSVHSPLLSEEQRVCRNNIYDEYGLDTVTPLRLMFPRINDRKTILDQNFRLKLLSRLSSIDVKQYFEEVESYITAKGQETPRKYCKRIAKVLIVDPEGVSNVVVHVEDNEEIYQACMNRLWKYFKDSDDIEVVLKVAYRSRLESDFNGMENDDHAKKYYKYLTGIIDFYNTLPTPAKFCNEIVRNARFEKLLKRNQPDFQIEEESESPKIKRSKPSTSKRTKHGQILDNQ